MILTCTAEMLFFVLQWKKQIANKGKVHDSSAGWRKSVCLKEDSKLWNFSGKHQNSFDFTGTNDTWPRFWTGHGRNVFVVVFGKRKKIYGSKLLLNDSGDIKELSSNSTV